MTRETKYNLIFIACFLAVSLPGAVILFKKKLDPNARAMYLPDPVKQRVAFVDPLPRGRMFQRVAPPMTRVWTNTLCQTITTESGRRVCFDTVASQQRRFQPIVAAVDGDRVQAALLLWDETFSTNIEQLQVQLAGAHAVVTSNEIIEVPDAVRRELREVGYNDPPGTVVMLRCHAEVTGLTDPFIVTVEAGGQTDQCELSLDYPIDPEVLTPDDLGVYQPAKSR